VTFQISAKVQTVFGSQTRAKVLGYLAESSVPQTGYAISKGLEIGFSKVYKELKNLEACGVLVGNLDARGSKQFLLSDEDLRNFLIKNLRILQAEEWFTPRRIAERKKNFEEANRIAITLPRAPARAGKRRRSSEFRRAPEKDRALNRVRKAQSRPR
jgi:DNA-binding PadR family transcriptional regulator